MLPAALLQMLADKQLVAILQAHAPELAQQVAPLQILQIMEPHVMEPEPLSVTGHAPLPLFLVRLSVQVLVLVEIFAHKLAGMLRLLMLNAIIAIVIIVFIILFKLPTVVPVIIVGAVIQLITAHNLVRLEQAVQVPAM
jgi:hypothetical protein